MTDAQDRAARLRPRELKSGEFSADYSPSGSLGCSLAGGMACADLEALDRIGTRAADREALMWWTVGIAAAAFFLVFLAFRRIYKDLPW